MLQKYCEWQLSLFLGVQAADFFWDLPKIVKEVPVEVHLGGADGTHTDHVLAFEDLCLDAVLFSSQGKHLWFITFQEVKHSPRWQERCQFSSFHPSCSLSRRGGAEQNPAAGTHTGWDGLVGVLLCISESFDVNAILGMTEPLWKVILWLLYLINPSRDGYSYLRKSDRK